MQTLTRFSWIFLVVGLLLFVAAGSYWFVYRATDTTWQALLIGAGVLLSAYAFFDRDRVAEGASSRAFRYGGGAALLVVLVGVLAVGSYVLAERHDTQWDLTREKRFTLSDQSAAVLGALQQDVEVLAFFRTGSADERRFDDLAEQMQQHTGRLQVQRVDPLHEPMLAERHEVRSEHGTIVLKLGERTQRLETEFDEEAVINALVRLTSGEDHVICWSVGHGELDPDDDTGAAGMGFAVVGLEDLNYTVKKTRLLTEGIDPTCEALVLASPQQDLLPHEREAVAAYIAGGGRALVMLDPDTAPETAAELERFGVLVGDDIVLESRPEALLTGLEDMSVFVLAQDLNSFAPHAITQSLRGFAILGQARSVGEVAGAQGLEVLELAHTSAQSWAETDLETMPPTPGENERSGQIPVLVAVEVIDPSVIAVASAPAAAPDAPVETVASAETGGLKTDLGQVTAPERATGVPAGFTPEEGGRLVVVGDADFATNRFVQVGPNNRDLFMNAIAWLVEEESQLGERPTGEGERLTLTVVQELALWLVSILLVPAAAVGMAVLVLVRRRFL